MENAFSKIVSILLLIAIVYVVPLKYYMDKSRSLEELYVTTKTIEFVDSVRNTGFITLDMYEQYSKQLSNLSRIYKMELEHIEYFESEDGKAIEKDYIHDIENQIYNNSIYQFEINDYFKVQVIETSSKVLVTYYGGYIKNETY